MHADLHHVSLPVADLPRATAFYTGILGLREIPHPPAFEQGPNSFGGAWYQLGFGQLHLIRAEPARAQAFPPTFRAGRGIDSRDVHFALRVPSFGEALRHLWAKGYRTGHPDAFLALRINPNLPHQGAGFPQLYLLDPDRHTVEINAATLDLSPEELAPFLDAG
jgi:glyoxylase I family protein